MIKKNIFQIIIATLLEFFLTISIIFFQKNILLYMILPVRAVLIIVLQWVLLIVPVIFILINKEKPSDLGFSKNNIIIPVSYTHLDVYKRQGVYIVLIITYKTAY